MSRREHGLCIRTDLVSDLAGASESAITPDDDHLDFASLHQMAGCIVCDYIMCDALLRQLPGCECSALATGACLIAKNVKPFSFGLRGIEGRCRSANIDEREPTRVAMGEDFHPIADERRAMPAYFPAMFNVFARKRFGCLTRELLALFYGSTGSDFCAHLQHGIDRINGRGSGLL